MKDRPLEIRARIAQTTPLACPQTSRKNQCETEFSSEQAHSEKQVPPGEIVGSVVDDGRPQGLPLLGFGGRLRRCGLEDA